MRNVAEPLNALVVLEDFADRPPKPGREDLLGVIADPHRFAPAEDIEAPLIPTTATPQ